ncbi:serine carboxypeptidase-like 13 [Oryza glaberrima]|uniref:serine carboxypeptidase-like 13 n=1 Tax=Oryza glaberrima TaxID=4538 RepID=UPI00224C21F0|nr:serine carboxypeptidase-like 13 [Oryza glaberrima]
MVAKRSTSRHDWRRWWWRLLPLACCFVCWVASTAVTVAAAAGVTVTSLPGFDGPLPFSLETGYVEVNESTGVRLFYYFVKSEKDPDVDPLLLWLSGPFQFAAKRYYSGGLPEIIYRPETWTKVSNIIFVDSPVGAGFSYAATMEGSKSSDTKTVKQLYIFLRKGYVAGNPVTDSQFDEDGKIPCLHGMGLISNELYEHAKETCIGKYSAPGNARCEQSIQAIRNCTKDINMLHVLEPLCEEVWSPRIHNTSATDGMSRLMLESARAADDDIIEFKCRKASYVVLKIWANDKTVRESLGVHKGTVGKWTRCNYDIDYIKDVYSTVEYHLTLMREGYRALIYSGDHDCGIPFTSTQAWIRFLNLSVVDDWRPWYVAGQVAGFTRSHANNNLIYATVKGAGHTAPEYKPKECLEMFARWISGNTL